ncbi:zinc-dependent peptidase [Aequorivita echinoideorum]|uniref:Zinc-dependent peptidase n=1 Tax=Aequorivita echinoideorum TaxID=1549647 RepID=A0ABS5S297_9FLAO|nr:zinc-dependent peptidase [Aequorivita echinoideorum]MBT0607299.1 zinc-dependent peptidase [Aequorivita echinoideorum]
MYLIKFIIHVVIEQQPYAPWLAPYAFSIIVVGFFFFLFKIFETAFAHYYNRPLFRYYLVYKKLTRDQKSILETEFVFYQMLSEKHKKQFEHRVANFINEKKFVERGGVAITERMKLLVAAIGCMLSFGRKNYLYALIDFVLIYPEEFYSSINEHYHKGEFNPREKALVLSWKDFENGYKIENDNLNVGIHEFTHAMQLEAKQAKDIDSVRFTKQFQKILKQLAKVDVREKLEKTRFFRMYAFTNQYEFMAVLAEYFIESPTELKSNFPEIYNYTKTILNFNFNDY